MLQERKTDEAEEARQRAMHAAHGAYWVPAYRGHWSAVVLFAASMVGAAMLWSCLPTAMSVLRGDAPGERTAATFLALYAAMAVVPAVGWALWGFGRRWLAMAVVALFVACVMWLSPAISQ